MPILALPTVNQLRELLRLLRPYQWSKNVFVLVGLVFGRAWADSVMVGKVVVVVIAFSLLSSAVYIFNDVADLDRDRSHPKKRNRPLAAATVSIRSAMFLSLVLAASALALAGSVSRTALAILIGYGVINIAYSLKLKHVVILDVFIIAAGFLMRVLAGTAGVGIPPSQWLILCSLMLTLFLGFAKRRAELIEREQRATEGHRQVLDQYSPALLDNLIAVTAACALMSYGLYTVSPETVRAHQTENLAFTLPFVMYAIFRYMFVLHYANKGAEPSVDLVRDPHILGAVAGWVVVTLWLIA
jgi:4-hydroxybenzoate polyprenyltransferase